MVKHYPHTLVVTHAATSTQDASGNWVTGVETTTELNCRAEPNKGNAFITAEDGNRINYEWIVFIPLPVTAIKLGSMVTVKNAATVLSQNKVLRFSEGQLNARVWL